MLEEDFDEYSHMESSVKSAQDELLEASIRYDAILKNKDSYTYDYIEAAAGIELKARMRIDTVLVGYYLLYPDKLNALLKKETDGSSLENVMSLEEFVQDFYEDPDRYEELDFSTYIHYVLDSI